VRSTAIALTLLAITSSQVAEAQSAGEPATDAKSGPRLSLSLERFASANAVFFRLEEGEDELKLRSKGITAGGPIANPLGASRLSADFLLGSGLTLGTGLAFAIGDLDSDENGDERDEGSYSLFMLAPRIGYRMELADWLDLTPRAGMTFGWASIGAGEYEYCDYYYDPETGEEDSDCSGAEEDSIHFFAAVANLELTAAWRLTDSFNLLTGLSYDLLVAARAVEKEGGGDSSTDDEETFKDGHMSSLQLWLGLGGYL
jgi:hypothetical protein